MEIAHHVGRAIQGFGHAMNILARQFTGLAVAIRQTRDNVAWVVGRSPAHKYALTGYCYGKNTRGKKRWLLEMSQRRRGISS